MDRNDAVTLPPSPRLTIVMPALNEEDNIHTALSDTLTAFTQFKIAGEIVVINDGSKDRTQAIVEEFMKRDSRVRLVTHATPQGIGASFWDGVEHSRADIVCMLPGDGENDPFEIMRYFPLLQHVDLVIPFVFNKQVRSLFRNTLSFVYRFIINTTFLVYFNYTNGTVMYRKSILKEIDFHSTGFFFQTDILIRTVKRGYLFAEVPYHLNMRVHGVSKAVSFPSFFRVVKGYLRLVQDYYYNKAVRTPEHFAKGSLTESRYEETAKAEDAAPPEESAKTKEAAASQEEALPKP